MPFSKHLPLAALPVLLLSCSVSKQIGRSAQADIIDNKALQTAHIGISLYDPAAGKYLYNYQGDKYFVPASNTKIPTCYAAMKYLGDSLAGLRYGIPEEGGLNSKYVLIQPTGDPSFLHPDYIRQPVYSFLISKSTDQQKTLVYVSSQSEVERWGSGWSWNDYEEPYMAERSLFPVFGNTITIRLQDLDKRIVYDSFSRRKVVTKLFTTGIPYFDSIVNLHRLTKIYTADTPSIVLRRNIATNDYFPGHSAKKFTSASITFVNEHSSTTLNYLSSALRTKFSWGARAGKTNKYSIDTEDGDILTVTITNWQTIHSQPTDSLLKPMMHRSDNFFAEQSLLMVSNEHLGYVNDAAIIDTLLKTDLRDLPQKPRWVDGSGLSRYNLFTPQDLVAILHKMQKEFGMDRIKNILPTGGEGTISSYYKADSGYIFVKTGTLSGVVALSGFLYTKKGKEIIFSILVNNHQASATEVRRAVEKFIQGVRNRY